MTDPEGTPEALRTSEKRYRHYFDLGLVGMAMTSPSKGCLEVNDELCRILGYDRSELVRKNWTELTHPDDLAADVAQFDRVMAGEIDGYSMEKRWIRKDGRVIDTIMTAQCVRRSDGTVDYFVGLVLDITARKVAEELLHKAQLELAHITRVTTMGELAASIAHEVSQPLAAILVNSGACARWLTAEPPNLDEAYKAVQRIMGNANRATDVVTRIRGILRREESRTPLDINDAIREVTDLTRREVRIHGVSLHIELAAGLPRVMADRIQLQQVTLNLIMNAVEAMATAMGRPRVLDIRTELAGAGAVTVSVRDSGVGLDPSHRDRIFDAFHSTKPQGMGMGLAISRSIVEAHGGRLWATANPDRGETFRFTVPVVGSTAP